jgi:hypothetical protein
MANSLSGQPLTALALPKRAVNALERGGIRTLEEAAEWSDDALLSLPHIGRTFVAALRAAQYNPEH